MAEATAVVYEAAIAGGASKVAGDRTLAEADATMWFLTEICQKCVS